MTNNNSVVFKGQKNGIVILLDEKIPFDDLKISFASKVSQAKNFFGNSKTSIKFKGRELTEDEEKELLNIISNESKLNISYIDDGYTLSPISSNEELDKILVKTEIDPNENITHYHKGSVRSGQSIRFAGSIVIIGDVNPGGEVVAEGNVTVLGALKGFVHAGSKGNRGCFISAYILKPTQLRIADIISYIPPDIVKKRKLKFDPALAYIEDGQIYIAPLL